MTKPDDDEKRAAARKQEQEAFSAQMPEEDRAAFFAAEQMSRIGFDTPDAVSSAEKVRESPIAKFWPKYKAMGSDLALQRMVFGLYQVAHQPPKRTAAVVKAIRERVEFLMRDI